MVSARRRRPEPPGRPADRLDRRRRRGRGRDGSRRRRPPAVVPEQGLAARRLDLDHRPDRHHRRAVAEPGAGRREDARQRSAGCSTPQPKASTSGIGPDGVERVGAFVPPARQQRPPGQRRPFQAAPRWRRSTRPCAGTWSCSAPCAALAFAAAALGGRHFIRRPVEQLSAAAARLRGGRPLGARRAARSAVGARPSGAPPSTRWPRAIEARERDLRRSEELFRQFAENIPEVVWVEDAATGRIEYVGPAYEAIWQRPAADVRDGRADWLEAVPTPRTGPALVAALDAGPRRRSPLRPSTGSRGPDGSRALAAEHRLPDPRPRRGRGPRSRGSRAT